MPIRPTQYCYPPALVAPAHPSGTLVLLQDADDAPLQVLLSQRSAHAAFAPGAYVFPGGKVDPEDEAAAASYCAAHAHALRWPPAQYAQAFAALRETFEEMGVLIACQADGRALPAHLLAQALPTLARSMPVHAQLAARGWRLMPEALALHAIWVTGEDAPRRYDTAFFLARMPAQQTPAADGYEQMPHLWLTPQAALNPPDGSALPMLPPTQHTLLQLQAGHTVAQALATAQAQTAVPIVMTRVAQQGGRSTWFFPQQLPYAEIEMLAPHGVTQHTIDWQHTQPVPLLRHIQRLTAPNPSMMTGPGTNTYLIGTPEQGFVVLDAGPVEPAHTERLLQALGTATVHALLCTHSHPDHAPGAFALQKRLAAQGRQVPVLGMASSPTAAAHSQFVPDIAVAHLQTLLLPATASAAAITLRMLHTPGHAANHLCVLLEEDGILFSGDHILSGSTTVIALPDGDMNDYLASLDLLTNWCAQHHVEWILPAHGYALGGTGLPSIAQGAAALASPPRRLSGAERVIAALRAHRLAREEKVLHALRSTGIQPGQWRSPAPEHLLQTLVPLAYADTDPALWPVAKRSLAAHLQRIAQNAQA